MDWQNSLALPSKIFRTMAIRAFLIWMSFFTKPGPYDPDVPFGTSIFGVYKDLYEREFSRP